MASTSSDPATRAVGRRIRHLRQRAGLSLEQLAERTGMTPERLSRLERGVQSPTVRTLDRVARGLGIDLISLFWSERVGEHIGMTQIPERVREIVEALMERTDHDLLRARVVLHAIFAERARLEQLDRARDAEARDAEQAVRNVDQASRNVEE